MAKWRRKIIVRSNDGMSDCSDDGMKVSHESDRHAPGSSHIHPLNTHVLFCNYLHQSMLLEGPQTPLFAAEYGARGSNSFTLSQFDILSALVSLVW